jgi:hypothetical protein
MNATDLARLELAKRAYRAVEPSTLEVQRGVRKARLSLRRPRQRRAWLSKTLVAVVLAMGGLAYANPHALGEWVESTLRTRPGHAAKGSGGASAAVPSSLSTKLVAGTPAQADAPARSETAEAPPTAVAPSPPAAAVEALPAPAAPKARALARARPAASRPGTASSERDEATPASAAASEWGRVGAALASGDEPRALLALEALSHSDDPRTRDKADLGRAQLLMANGQRAQACTMARSLTQRRAGGRIERQALVLLKSCGRHDH